MAQDASSPPSATPLPLVKKVLVGLLVFFCLFVVGAVGVFGWAFVRFAQKPPDSSRMSAQGPIPLDESPVLPLQVSLKVAGCEKVDMVSLPTPRSEPGAAPISPLDSPGQLLSCAATDGSSVDCEMVAKIFLAAARPKGSFLTAVTRPGKPGCTELYTAEGVQRAVPASLQTAKTPVAATPPAAAPTPPAPETRP